MWYASPLAPCGTANGTVTLPDFFRARACVDSSVHDFGCVLTRFALVIIATFSICVGMP